MLHFFLIKMLDIALSIQKKDTKEKKKCGIVGSILKPNYYEMS